MVKGKFQTDNGEFYSKACKDFVAVQGRNSSPYVLTHLRPCLLLNNPWEPLESWPWWCSTLWTSWESVCWIFTIKFLQWNLKGRSETVPVWKTAWRNTISRWILSFRLQGVFIPFRGKAHKTRSEKFRCMRKEFGKIRGARFYHPNNTFGISGHVKWHPESLFDPNLSKYDVSVRIQGEDR